MAEDLPSKEQIGIFGGSFNPPHAAHLIIAEIVREQFGLDRILWIPNSQSPFKKREQLAPAEERLRMTELTVRGNEAFAVSDLEVRRSGISYTVDTIRRLQEENPTADYRLIIGSDSLAGFEGWKEPEEIIRNARPVVFKRPGDEGAVAPVGYAHLIDFADAPLLQLSSTTIRKRLANGRTVRYMVPDAVYDYIMDRRLYSR